MSSCKRLSICYAVPGHDLLPSAGPTLNVLSVAEALSKHADVTVAFRRVLEPIAPTGYEVVAIEPKMEHSLRTVDDAAVRGIGFREFLAYLGSLRRFVDERLQLYDIVLEKSWLLSGYLAHLCRRRGYPAVVVENIVRVWNEPLRNCQAATRYIQYLFTQALVGHFLRQVPLIVAETEELRAALAQRWQLPLDRISVVGLGMNRHLFYPQDQASARRVHDIAPEVTVLLYVGGLDKTHNLTPVLEAMRQVSAPALQLHIVGDGIQRSSYEARCQLNQRNVFFHGRVPHHLIPQYIAAADLCLAPYDLTAFPNGQVSYSTLKIPEYMACARPVVSVPSGHIRTLIQHRVSGFLFHNDMKNWADFLRRCPSRQQLQQMGVAAASQVAHYDWEATGLAYLSLCEQLLQRHSERHRAPCSLRSSLVRWERDQI
jgi:glycosyltransferase involved in cell wall biosynthesis